MLIKETEQFVKTFHANDFSGHDYAHIERVRKMALRIAAREGGDVRIIELAALLHDVADSKIGGTSSRVDSYLTPRVSTTDRHHILDIINSMSFKGGDRPPMQTLEGKIVQDADRLDAIGAIGIARTFQFAGQFKEPMYRPELTARQAGDRTSPTSALHHFEEKLLRLKDLMNTQTAKTMAEDRHEYMVKFVERFKEEWSGD
ncbi:MULTISPECIES: HD domain-containing protein [Exiguobacterium]|uniref:HD domain-containing protein n=1 Tax=Exiguobacterium TaxID=33986 RepID=UPI000285E7CB|nr:MULTISPECIES: HD domain-containing protein [Exiguobacterium]AFS70056.1 metal dependent phosphohydrolase [Exiguobacterium antarcticum B7]MCT4779474.1 HD domain-containing protein [Exiguobacterium soli]